jgi:hypothetical protein
MVDRYTEWAGWADESADGRHQRATQRATHHEHLLTDKAFVFSAEQDGSLPWLPNRVTKIFINERRRAGVGQFRDAANYIAEILSTQSRRGVQRIARSLRMWSAA